MFSRNERFRYSSIYLRKRSFLALYVIMTTLPQYSHHACLRPTLLVQVIEAKPPDPRRCGYPIRASGSCSVSAVPGDVPCPTAVWRWSLLVLITARLPHTCLGCNIILPDHLGCFPGLGGRRPTNAPGWRGSGGGGAPGPPSCVLFG